MFLSLRKRFHISDHGLCLFANVFVSPTMVFASSPMFLCLRPWSERLRKLFLSLRKRFHVSDHGLCLFANIFVSSTMVFASSPMFLCLRPWSLPLRQCFWVFDHGLCFFANVFVSSTIVFVSSTMVVMPASIVFASVIALSYSLKLRNDGWDGTDCYPRQTNHWPDRRGNFPEGANGSGTHC